MTTATMAPVRITVYGPDGSADTGIWSGTTPVDLVGDGRVRAALGLQAGEQVAVVSRSGARLRDDSPLLDQRVGEGDVLTVLVPARAAQPAGQRVGHRMRVRSRRTPRTRERGARRLGPVVTALVLLTLAGVVSVPAGGAVRALTAYVLLAVALLGAVAVPREGWGDSARLLAPAAAAAGVLTLLAGSGPGRMHLALTAAAVAAAVIAAAARVRTVRAVSAHDAGQVTTTQDGADRLLVVLVLASTVAGVLGTGLLIGTPLRACAVMLAAGATLTPRLLPSAVVGVPDEALLELDRLSVTAWSAHERLPQQGWRRLRAHDVTDLITRARRLFGTTTVLCCALAVVGAIGALTGDPLGLARVGAAALAICVGLTMALSARSVRDRAGRASLLAGGAVLGLASAAVVLAGLGTGWRLAVLVTAVLAGIAVVPAAVALGRGWHSVRWARTGDVLEGLAVALVVPAAFVATGGFDWVRQLAA